MKFLYSDTQDYVDPNYDFLNDRNSPGRERYWDDVYAHQIFDIPPYDGLLVAMSALRQIEGITQSKARYSTKEEMRFLREGARKFLRLTSENHKNMYLMGDCGAFAYADKKTPAFSPEEVIEFYSESGFTHGISPDHVIFELDDQDPPDSEVSSDNLYRYEITLSNAEKFLYLAKKEAPELHPIASAQGWSPASIARAATKFENMGFDYIAIGGLVPLRTETIKKILASVRQAIKPETKLHLLGFAKAETIHEFTKFGIHSFDSTSPLIRAFKDSKANYYLQSESGGLEYYAAIRIPQYSENPKFLRAIKAGKLNAEELHKLEQNALKILRLFDENEVSIKEAIAAVESYMEKFFFASGLDQSRRIKAQDTARTQLARTLREKPWKRCNCEICRVIGIEVIIFRSANRNRRRGFHNLYIYKSHLAKIVGR